MRLAGEHKRHKWMAGEVQIVGCQLHVLIDEDLNHLQTETEGESAPKWGERASVN
jgi:hypothetical protein